MKMRILGKILGVVLLFFFFFTAPSTADIISLKIKSHNRDIIGFTTFEFSHTGYVSVAVSSVGISSIPVTSNLSQPDLSRIGFFLVPYELSDPYDRHESIRNPNFCPFGNNSISVLFTFNNLSQPSQASFNKTYHVTNPGEYSLYFANCNDQTLVTMDVRTELYNTDDDGTTKDYLSAGQPQPSFYFKFSLIYLGFLGFWISISLNSHKCLLRIHLLLGVLLVITILHFLCAMEDHRNLQVTGIHHGSWHALVYIIQFIRNLLFFTVIVLISTGWCFWKLVLTGCDRFGLTMVILLQVWVMASYIKAMESVRYSEHWQYLMGNFQLIDLFCCVVVAFHPLFSVGTFKEDKDVMLAYAATSGRWPYVFPSLFLTYVFYSRGMMNMLLERTVPLEEIGTLVFTIVMFYMYRPLCLEDEVLYSKGFLDDTSKGFLDDTGV